jgi:hypothetical protein
MSTQNHSKPKIAKYYDIYDIGQSKSHLLGLSLARSLDNSSFLLSNTGFANDFPAISTEVTLLFLQHLICAHSVHTDLIPHDHVYCRCGFNHQPLAIHSQKKHC